MNGLTARRKRLPVVERRWASGPSQLVRRPYKPPNCSALCAGNGLHLASLTAERVQFRGAALTGEIGAISMRVGATAAAVIYLDWATRPHVMPVPQMECPCERPRAGGQAVSHGWLLIQRSWFVRPHWLLSQVRTNKSNLVFSCFSLSFPPGSTLDVSFILQAVLWRVCSTQAPDSRGSPEVNG